MRTRYTTCERCGNEVDVTYGDAQCRCGAIYNAFEQRLRDDLYSRPNPSDWDDDISDLDGYEIAMLGGEES